MTVVNPTAQYAFPITLKKFVMIVTPLIIANIFAMTVTFMQPGSHFDLRTALVTSINGFTWISLILCLPLGLLVALIPYKSLPYRHKRSPAWLLVFFVFQAITSLIGFIPAIIQLRQMP